jgi:hypothetical protein
MYAGVPSDIPVRVSVWASAALVTARAMPKSATTACPASMRMFSGLMSRWTMRVRVLECVRDLARDADGFVDAELALAIQAVSERLTFDERHHVVQRAVGFPRIVDGEDVGVRQMRRDLDLTIKALTSEGGSQLGEQHLDRDAAIDLYVRREVDGGHATSTELALDRVAMTQCCAKSLDDHHRSPERLPHTCFCVCI